MGKIYNSPQQDARYQTRRNSNLWEAWNKWGKPYNCTSLLPWESFQLDVMQSRGARTGHRGPPDIRRWSWGSVETNVVRVQWTVPEKREIYRERYLQICRGTSWVFSWVLIRTNVRNPPVVWGKISSRSQCHTLTQAAPTSQIGKAWLPWNKVECRKSYSWLEPSSGTF